MITNMLDLVEMCGIKSFSIDFGTRMIKMDDTLFNSGCYTFDEGIICCLRYHLKQKATQDASAVVTAALLAQTNSTG